MMIYCLILLFGDGENEKKTKKKTVFDFSYVFYSKNKHKIMKRPVKRPTTFFYKNC